MIEDLEFEDIRPYYDEEVKGVLLRLQQDNSLYRFAKMMFQNLEKDELDALITHVESIRDFQVKLVYAGLKSLYQKSAEGITFDGLENLDPSNAYLLVSNHRDIILDPATLNMLLYENGFDTTRIAIGNNLLSRPWIRDLARLNKSFIVYRNLPLKQMYTYSQKLSRYIRKSIFTDRQSVWIAQREGRAKDGNDITQLSLLKMLSFVERKQPLEYLSKLRIVPVSISYEYDPCDLLKVREIIYKQQNKNYKKSASEDVVSMLTGLKGYKGRIHLRIGKVLSDEMDYLILHESEREHLTSLAALIDENIQKNYRLWPSNYIAYDLLVDKPLFQSYYSRDDKQKFEEYYKKKISEIKGSSEDTAKLFLKIYANSVKNVLRYR